MAAPVQRAMVMRVTGTLRGTLCAGSSQSFEDGGCTAYSPVVGTLRRRALCSWLGWSLDERAPAAATGAPFCGALIAGCELDYARDPHFQASCPRLRLTFRRGSSLMLSTRGLTHTMWSGCSILYPLALGLRTCLPEPKNILLTVSFRLALWTGQFTVVPRAIFLFCDMPVHHVKAMRVHDLEVCTPLQRQLHPISKSSI